MKSSILHRLVLPLFAASALALSACGTNPVTGKKEVQFISEAGEIQIGQQNYAPSRQSQGGDYVVLPELTTYVNEVGQKLAAVSDRQLPYEFVVLNSSVPNAWALPGGKIAVNRGLLTTLENEGELAAVLGHEIVHAAARHGAKAQERGTFLQVGMVAAQIGVAMSDVNPNIGNLGLQVAGLGAQAFMMKYGRGAELESDEYGMKYMRKAGYDPSAAVTLQQKFLALAQKDGRTNQSWLEGLFASHPPSAERVERNQQSLAVVGTGGELGVDRYKARLAPLLAIKPAYDKADEALVAATKKEFGRAKALAGEATQMLPREASFHQLLGDLAMAEKQPQQALSYYEKAIQINPNYFGPYLGGGVASYKTGNKQRAEQWLTKSTEMLPTAPAIYYLGMIAKEQGNNQRAAQLFKQVAGAEGELGQRAAAEYTLLDLPQNPGNYVATALQRNQQGAIVAVIQNRSPVALSAVAVTPVRVDAQGRVLEQGRTIQVNRVLQPGEQIVIDAGIGAVTPEVAQQLRVRVDGARPAQ
jgi:predicted Zn-dependent protease